MTAPAPERDGARHTDAPTAPAASPRETGGGLASGHAAEAARPRDPLAPPPARRRPDPRLFRVPTEDDDGYDPYSDFHDQGGFEPRYEADPWR